MCVQEGTNSTQKCSGKPFLPPYTPTVQPWTQCIYRCIQETPPSVQMLPLGVMFVCWRLYIRAFNLHCTHVKCGLGFATVTLMPCCILVKSLLCMSNAIQYADCVLGRYLTSCGYCGHNRQLTGSLAPFLFLSFLWQLLCHISAMVKTKSFPVASL